MRTLTNKQRVEMAVKIISSHSYGTNDPIHKIKKEDCGDYLLSVHRTSFPDVYKVADALHVTVVIQEPSTIRNNYFNLFIC